MTESILSDNKVLPCEKKNTDRTSEVGLKAVLIRAVTDALAVGTKKSTKEPNRECHLKREVSEKQCDSMADLYLDESMCTHAGERVQKLHWFLDQTALP